MGLGLCVCVSGGQAESGVEWWDYVCVCQGVKLRVVGLCVCVSGGQAESGVEWGGGTMGLCVSGGHAPPHSQHLCLTTFPRVL